MSLAEESAIIYTSLQCSNCGAALKFAPGTHSLKCPYCGTMNEIVDTEAGPVVPVDYETFIKGAYTDNEVQQARVVSCKNCGAATTLPPEVNSDNCAFCASPLVLSEAEGRQLVKPHYILPFVVTQPDAVGRFKLWMDKLWFAPSDLSKMVSSDSKQLKGVYIPHWSYDAESISDYNGSRGEYYYTTETYSTEENGEQVTRTREVRHTAWFPVRGTVHCTFNDVMISASTSLPQKVASRLEPWTLEALVHYNEQYVSGFRSELYQLDAEKGFKLAEQRMEPIIRDAICNNIGGDEQSINDFDTQYDNIGLKYVLLPVWISVYRYQNKLYHFTVNACTGEVVGDRPYSVVKIVLVILAGLALLVMLFSLFSKN